MITVWGRASSANVQKVLWTLEDLGVAHERRAVGGGFGGTDDPAFRAMNPNGLVPVLRDGDLILWESDAIVRHLAETRGAGDLCPGDAAARARAAQWTFWTATTLIPAVAPLFLGMVRTPRAEQAPEALGPAADRLAAVMAILDAHLARHPFVAGEAFSFGDVSPAINARRALNLPFGAPTAPNVAAWIARLAARPGFRHVDVPMGTCLEEWTEIERRLG
jgi:Glutathione S-transferase